MFARGLNHDCGRYNNRECGSGSLGAYGIYRVLRPSPPFGCHSPASRSPLAIELYHDAPFVLLVHQNPVRTWSVGFNPLAIVETGAANSMVNHWAIFFNVVSYKPVYSRNITGAA